MIAYRSQWNDDHRIKIFDGDKNSTWHSDPFNEDQRHASMVRGRHEEGEACHQGFLIWQRQDDHGMEPKHVVFSVSEDNENWTVVLEETNLSNDYSKELDSQDNQSCPRPLSESRDQGNLGSESVDLLR